MLDNKEETMIEVGDEEKRLKRKHSLQASVTLGLGHGKKKQRHIEAFYSSLWPVLQDVGWTLLQGEGDEEGASYFLPPGVSMGSKGEVQGDVPTVNPASLHKDTDGAWDCVSCGHTNAIAKSRCAGSVDGVRCLAWRGGKRLHRPYFSKVRDVIERVLEKKGAAEAKAADAFVVLVPNATELFHKKDEKRDQAPSHSVSQGIATLSAWKEDRTHFEKASSRIGSEFQVDALPAAGSYIPATIDSAGALYERVWNPEEAEKFGRLEFVHTRVKFNKRESSYNMLHSRGYTIPGFYREVCDVSPTDCSNWTKADKDHFRTAVFEKHESMKEVSEMVGKPISECITYYLVKFRKTKSFKSLKRSMKRKANINEGSAGTLVCYVCGKGGMLVACDTCETHYHLACTSPRLESIPDGTWNCSNCKRGTRSMLSSQDDKSCNRVPNPTEGSAYSSTCSTGSTELNESENTTMHNLGGVHTEKLDSGMDSMHEKTGSISEQLSDSSSHKMMEMGEAHVAIGTAGAGDTVPKESEDTTLYELGGVDMQKLDAVADATHEKTGSVSEQLSEISSHKMMETGEAHVVIGTVGAGDTALKESEDTTMHKLGGVHMQKLDSVVDSTHEESGSLSEQLSETSSHRMMETDEANVEFGTEVLVVQV